LESFPLIKPDASTARAFADQVSSMFVKIAQNAEETKALAQTRDLLLPRLMSGELRVADAVIKDMSP
jgi:type I restriction enzyme S subunit